DAANRERRRVGAAQVARYDQIWHDGLQAFHVLDALALEHFARVRHDGDWHVLEILLTAGGRDDDLLETTLGGCAPLLRIGDGRITGGVSRKQRGYRHV